MSSARIIDGKYVYKVKLRPTSAGLAITIPVEVLGSLKWYAGDSMAIVLLDDGVVVSKVEDDEGGLHR